MFTIQEFCLFHVRLIVLAILKKSQRVAAAALFFIEGGKDDGNGNTAII
jgi:hypothetical protein